MPELPSIARLTAVLKLRAFPAGTHSERIRRAAQLMLLLKSDPGVYGVAHFAKLLSMSYSGAGKAMMGLRDLGLIKRIAYKVHVLTQKGEEYLIEAIHYVPPIE